jgi:Tfp pilus assembly protein PilF
VDIAGGPSAEKLIQEGMQAKARGDLGTATGKFREAIGADPKSPDAHWGLAWVLAAQSKNAEAIREFREVTRLAADPEMRREAEAAVVRLSQ